MPNQLTVERVASQVATYRLIYGADTSDAIDLTARKYGISRAMVELCVSAAAIVEVKAASA